MFNIFQHLSQAEAPERSVVRFVVGQSLAGMALGLVLAAGTLLLNVAGLRDVLGATDSLIPTLALLVMGFAITFGGAFCASAIMLLPQDELPPDSGRSQGIMPTAHAELIAVKLPAYKKA